MSLVSVIIPCLNAAGTIERALASCLAQSHHDLEVVVADDHSSDDSIQRARRLFQDVPMRLKVVTSAGRGANCARNAALDIAEGEYIQFLDADDELSPEKIARQLAAIDGDGDIAYGDWHWCFSDADGNISAEVALRSDPVDDYTLQLLVDNWRPPHCYLIRRAAIAAHPSLRRWNERTTSLTDREYFTAAGLLGLRFVHVANSQVRYHTWSQDQMTQKATHAERAASLADVFAGLNRLCADQEVKAEHESLLNQSWQCWRAPHSSATEHEHVANGNELGHAILRRMRDSAQAVTWELWSRYLTRGLLRQILSRQQQEQGYVDLDLGRQLLRSWLTQLCEDLGVPSPPVSIPDCRVEGESRQVLQFLTSGPLNAPLLALERCCLLNCLKLWAHRGLIEAE